MTTAPEGVDTDNLAAVHGIRLPYRRVKLYIFRRRAARRIPTASGIVEGWFGDKRCGMWNMHGSNQLSNTLEYSYFLSYFICSTSTGINRWLDVSYPVSFFLVDRFLFVSWLLTSTVRITHHARIRLYLHCIPIGRLG